MTEQQPGQLTNFQEAAKARANREADAQRAKGLIDIDNKREVFVWRAAHGNLGGQLDGAEDYPRLARKDEQKDNTTQ